MLPTPVEDSGTKEVPVSVKVAIERAKEHTRRVKVFSRIKESKENLQNRGEEEEEKILICNINLMSAYKGKIEAYK